MNSEAALFWYEQGVKRIILARELSIKQIKTMRQRLSEDLELEMFVHGAMCVSYSGTVSYTHLDVYKRQLIGRGLDQSEFTNYAVFKVLKET